MKLLLVLFAMASMTFAQSFQQCDVNKDSFLTVADVQYIANEALGARGTVDDLNGDRAVNLVDMQIVLDGVLGIGCPNSIPRYATVSVALLNRAWIPSDIPSPGSITVRASLATSTSVLNQYWNPSEIPSPGNVTVHAALAPSASVLNQAWTPADIPSPGSVTIRSAVSRPASVVNQAWISADIPSPGDVRFAAGLLVSVNNTASIPAGVVGPASRVKTIAGGSSTTPVDFASISDGDALIAGQSVRFRIFPPDGSVSNSDFLVNGEALRNHAPFEVLITAPANVATLDLDAVMFTGEGRSWKLPTKHLMVVPDSTITVTGRATRADGRPAVSAAVGVRTNGLKAEYFRADQPPASWADLKGEPDLRAFVTAINQPNPGSVFGPDPFGTGLSATGYTARFQGQIEVLSAGLHQFFLTASLGGRLLVDGAVVIDAAPGQVSVEPRGEATLTAGWHSIEIDSYHTAFNPSLQLSWRQPNSVRETVRPEALATEVALGAVTNAAGAFVVPSFPGILTPLEWNSVPANQQIRVVPDQTTSMQRPIQ